MKTAKFQSKLFDFVRIGDHALLIDRKYLSFDQISLKICRLV